MTTSNPADKVVYQPHPLLGALLRHLFGDYRIASLEPAGWTPTKGPLFNVQCVYCKRRSQSTASGLLDNPECGCEQGKRSKAARRRRANSGGKPLDTILLRRIGNWERDQGMDWATRKDALDWIKANINLPPNVDFNYWGFVRPDSDRPWGPDNIAFMTRDDILRMVGSREKRVLGGRRSKTALQRKAEQEARS